MASVIEDSDHNIEFLRKQLIQCHLYILIETAQSLLQKAKMHWEHGYSGILHF